MCGIVGYIGTGDSIPFLIQGLKRLEYRGYDSSGLAFFSQGALEVIKKKGRIGNLVEAIEHAKPEVSNIGIGHTRWATHGSPCDLNSHPHLSGTGNFALVHNGIIENYISLKKFLEKNGKTFISETDTEVIVQLIDHIYDGDFFVAVKKTAAMLEGSFALGIICRDCPDTLIAVKKDSPLIVGVGDGENYIASDIPAVLERTKKIYRMQEKEIAVLTKDRAEIYDFSGNQVKSQCTNVDVDVTSAKKNGYKHFMLKEIFEQPEVIKNTICNWIEDGVIKFENLNFSREYFENLSKIYIVACGSAYHVGCCGKYVIEKLTGKSVEVDLASEFRYRSPIIGTDSLVIAVSQSGETADTLAAVRQAKKSGAKVLSVVNVAESSVACESDYVIYTQAGPEIAVATTKAYSAQLCVIYLFALYLSKLLAKITQEEYFAYVSDIAAIPAKMHDILKDTSEIYELSKKYFNINNAFFIGRNLDYSTCMEASLKFKEVSYVHSEAYAAGELKHGAISLIQDGTLVIAVSTQTALVDKIISNVKEVKARGAVVLTVTTEEFSHKFSQVADLILKIPTVPDIFMPSLSVIPLQIFSYYVALLRGCDIDKPRNLAKSVTVE
jgi:glucosamine--fructose-6-phosphate aminotransferase (isomerizing)